VSPLTPTLSPKGRGKLLFAPSLSRKWRGKPRKVVLIGFMGTGKTVVGKALAKELGWRFLDTDVIIEKKEGRRVSTIFKREGEAYFRDVETRVIKDVSRLKNAVISAGGGAVLRDENVKYLKKNGVIVCLDASPRVILSRLKGDRSRPLLGKRHRLKNVRRLLRLRKPYYQVADYTVSTDSLMVPLIVGKILNRLTLPPQKG